MNVALLAPHPDDEIINSFGLLYNFIEKQNIYIIFLTNGDFHGKKTATIRYKESVTALELCNIPAHNIYHMGYADTGMPKEISFLHNLYNSNLDELLSSDFSQYTYHPAGYQTIHSLFFGSEAKYTKRNFIIDMDSILSTIQPDLVILPSSYDFHGDHAAAALFYNQYIKPHYNGISYYYLTHTKNDFKWPNRGKNIWSKPDIIPDHSWKRRKRIILSNSAKKLKKRAILSFQSQHPYAQDSFLLSFVKNEELFFNC